MTFRSLAGYRNLGWDFDGTLIDHSLSSRMWDFIVANPFDQEHHIVTFRSGGYEAGIFSELRARRSPLQPRHFSAIHNIPHRIWTGFHDYQGKPLDIPDHPYLSWKGERCADEGIDVLIDDMTHHVIDGCRTHAIPHIHPDDLV